MNHSSTQTTLIESLKTRTTPTESPETQTTPIESPWNQATPLKSLETPTTTLESHGTLTTSIESTNTQTTALESLETIAFFETRACPPKSLETRTTPQSVEFKASNAESLESQSNLSQLIGSEGATLASLESQTTSESATSESIDSQLIVIQSTRKSRIAHAFSIESQPIPSDSETIPADSGDAHESAIEPAQSVASHMTSSQPLESRVTHSQLLPEYIESSTTHTESLHSETEFPQLNILTGPCQTNSQSTETNTESSNILKMAMCLQCNQELCQTCSEKHVRTSVSKSHRVVPDIGSMTSDDWMLALNQSDYNCENHPSKKLSIYCEQCEHLGCARCLKDHTEHTCRAIQSIDSIISEKRQLLRHDRVLFDDLIEIKYENDEEVEPYYEQRMGAMSFYCDAIEEFGSLRDVLQMHALLRKEMKCVISDLPAQCREHSDLKERIAEFESRSGELFIIWYNNSRSLMI